jgi:hypothetical protein
MNVGTDLLLFNGEFVWEGDNLATVSGADNIQQQAYLRLLTDQGESIFFRDYGCKLQTLLSKPFTPENKQRAEADAKAALMQVGNANGTAWIEQVLECKIELVTIDGKQAKRLFAKYLIRGEKAPRQTSFKLEV